MRACLALFVLAAATPADDDGVALLLRQAADRDPGIRARAARALGRADDIRAVPALKAALRDADDAVRNAAAVSLARRKLEVEEVVDVLGKALTSASWFERWQACVALGPLGTEAAPAVPALVNAALDPSLDISSEAVRALCAVGPRDERALAGLAKLLYSDLPADRPFIVEALAAAERADLAAAWLGDEMRSDRIRRRGRAVELLLRAGEAGRREFLKGAKDAAPWVRMTSIGGLGRLGGDEAGAVVVAAATDENAEVRAAALGAIGDLKPKGGERIAAKALSDAAPDVRIAAAVALGEMKVKEPTAGPGLVRLLGPCGDGMNEILGAAGFPGLAAFLHAEEQDVEPGHVVRLRPTADSPEETEALDALIAEIEDEAHGEALVAALRETLAPRQDDILLAKLVLGEAPLRRAAAILLGHLGRDRDACRAALRKALKDEDAEVRLAAAEAIARLRAPR